MKEPVYNKSRTEMLAGVFDYLVKNGLENISIRDLCKEVGMASGSVYYWFSSKDNMLCDATEYGLRKVSDEIFEYAFNNINNLEEFFENCLDEVGKYKRELRFIYQMAASPVYGDKMRSKENDITYIYNMYADKLAAQLNRNKQKIRPLLYMFVATILDYVIWEDSEKTKVQLDFFYEALVS